MNWRQVARVALALIGFGVAAVIFVLSRNGPPPPAPPADLATLDPKASLEGGAGKIITGEGGSRLEIVFANSRRYDDGRTVFEQAQILNLDEHKATLRTDRLETRAAANSGDRPSHYAMSGHVALETGDGLAVQTDEATYDDLTGVVTMPGAVTYRRGRLSGTSVGALFERDTNTITLQAQAAARVEPDADGRGGVDATAGRMTLVRGQHSLQLDDQARIVGQMETLSGQRATMVFTEDETAVKYIELRGSARVTPTAGSSPDRPAMSADDITMSLHSDGLTLQHATLTGRAALTLTEAGRARSIRASWIDVFTAADGQTVTELRARDRVVVELPATATSPGRTITAATLQAVGDEKRGLTSARFEGNPRFEELQAPKGRGSAAAPPSKRTGTSTTLSLTLGGQLDAIEKAEFQQNAEFKTADATAWADLATYDQAKNTLFLNAGPREPRRPSRVETADMTVDATAIDLFLETEDLNARGGVTTRAVRTGAPAANQGSLFEGSDPVYGSSDTLEYRRARGAAVYGSAGPGQASLKQGQTKVVADRIQFVESTSNLDASGRVASTMQMSVSDPSGAPRLQTYPARADTLSYDDAKRTAVYQGQPAAMTTVDGDIEAQTLTLELAAESRALQRLRADGRVFGALSGGYQVAGDRLVYLANSETYSLTGAPARVKTPEGAAGEAPAGSGCKLSTSPTLVLNRRTGAVTAPGRGEAPRATVPVACDYSLRSGK